MTESRYSIGYVSRRTGLSQHVIRAWERRYQAVQPVRSGKNRRLYSEMDVQRLLLLKDASRSHHNLAQIARLSSDELLKLSFSNPPVLAPSSDDGNRKTSALLHLGLCLDAVRELDTAALEKRLVSGIVELGVFVTLTEIITPLMEEIGESWSQGKIRIAQEHAASMVIRNVLGNLIRLSQSEHSPVLIASTPAGQMHEFGALCAAIQAGSLGWNVHYLGPNLPAEEIALAVQTKGAGAIALSVTYKGEDAFLLQELQRLRSMLDASVSVLVGGPAAASYRPFIEQISGVYIPDLLHLKLELERIL